ncbi:carbon-nitrogen hydrolase family protein [Psychromonas sp. RZ22]|uniref:carbon-nitrogen hydrolase family protein n=1 Tax=Psychromonas algarum TaxID=2555643 RepID=UPI00106761CF|nr:carbon-nitrogen hydrolase family protein [Psychromonas sp. RZ22]TEW54327.1 carbon-nitrogen hydrolase family protein [Psychromonas sp. RZ22]
MNCKLTAIQIISSECVDANFEQIEIQLASMPKSNELIHHLVLLPENALCLGTRQDYFNSAENLGNGPCQTRLSQLAKQYNCTLICGSFPIKSDQTDKIYTCSLVYSPQGELLESYNKIHLFDADVTDTQGAYRESDTFIAGQEVKVIDLGFTKVGLAICYDLRFPGLFQALIELGAEIILLPAAFTHATGEAHWQALLQARAIETQCYFIAANQGGEHFSEHLTYKSRFTYGHSMIIDEWGEIKTQLTIGNGFIQTDFDKKKLQNTRKNMPVQQHNQFSSIQKLK